LVATPILSHFYFFVIWTFSFPATGASRADENTLRFLSFQAKIALSHSEKAESEMRQGMSPTKLGRF